jgi:hypothetical protein
MTAREAWKEENDGYDADVCGDKLGGQMYKVMCDLHCVEDAVVKGNHAILKSMKTIEKHLVSTIKKMMGFYTNEMFEKIKETQTQINANDEGMSDILTSYMKQGMDQNTEYSDQIIDSIRDNVIPPMQKIQEDIGKVNENLEIINSWLQSNEVLNPPEMDFRRNLSSKSAWLRSSPLHDLHVAFGATSDAYVDLVRSLHGMEASSGIDDDSISRVLKSLERAVKFHAVESIAALKNHNFTEAARRVAALTLEMRRAQALVPSARTSASSSLKRRSASALRNTHRRLLTETSIISSGHADLSAFHDAQLAIMIRASNVRELSDQAEHFAAADMMVRFDAEILRAKRAYTEYLSAARNHLKKRAIALGDLQQLLRNHNGCTATGDLQRTSVNMAVMTNAEERHLFALQEAWRDISDSVSQIATLLVDGGLLVHHIRLTVGVANTSTLVDHPLRGDLEEHSLSLERRLKSVLDEDAGAFMHQVNRAFTLSQSLADMWAAAGLERPEVELSTVQNAWARVSKAAQELYTDLQPGRSLRYMLLLTAAETSLGNVVETFPPPNICRQNKLSEGAALWRKEPEQNATQVLLLAKNGEALRCDLRSGKIELLGPSALGNFKSQAPSKATAGLAPVDLGSFLLPLM